MVQVKRKQLKWLRVTFLFSTSTFLLYQLSQTKSEWPGSAMASILSRRRDRFQQGFRTASVGTLKNRSSFCGARIPPRGPKLPSLPSNIFCEWLLSTLPLSPAFIPILYLRQCLPSSFCWIQFKVSYWQSVHWPWIHNWSCRLTCWSRKRCD